MIRRSVGAVALVIWLATPLAASSEGITQQQASAILEELKQIRQLLEKNLTPAPPRAANPACTPDRKVKLPTASTYQIGREDAPVTLVEFADYECPFCRQFHVSAFEQLKTDYIDTGKLRFVSRDLPLEFHKHSTAAASAARCAGEQGKYWELRQAMLVNGDRLDSASVVAYAGDLGLDLPRFQECLASQKYVPAIRKDMADAQAVGITGTPSFVLGRTAKDGIEGAVIVGALPFAAYEAKIREVLGK